MTNSVRTTGSYVSEGGFSAFYWPSIVAGAFVTLALLAVSVVLARACDVDITFRNAMTRGAEVGAIIWGGISALICFAIGGYVAARGASVMRRSIGWLNGLLVWAVVVPILVYVLGTGFGPRLGQTAEFGNAYGTAVQASAVINARGTAESVQPETTGSPHYVSHAQAAAWWMLVSLALGLIGSLATGFVSGPREITRYEGGTTTTTTTP